MTATQSSAQKPTRSRRSLSNVAAFAVGVPLAAGILAAIHLGALAGTPLHHYLSHSVEQVEIVLFCIAVSGLGAKVWQNIGERWAFRADVLPEWNGETVPVAEAPKLLAGISRLSRSVQKSWLVNRVAGILDFLASRGSAGELDDHLRDQADGDAMALENSYALIRFITWAIPILGFLGTVLGITGAINGVTPEKLENNISEVTDGLALAFNATALALALTMVTMFLSYLVDRLEQGVLESVDQYTTRNLAHRFERDGGHGEIADMVRQNTQAVLKTTDDVVKRQAEVWAKTLEEINQRHAEAAAKAQERMTAALESALDRTLKSHAERLAVTEKVNSKLLEQVATLAASLTQQSAALAKLQEGEKHLVRLQETLARNLDSLAGAGSFEEAVHSLTAAVHLLTARATASGVALAPRESPPVKRPGVAA
jgi:biopolymer transport protein ExbB/TolQ